MGVFARGPRQEEEPGGGSSLRLDLDLRACPSCRRELHPWEAVCPADGSAAVARADLGAAGLPAPPAHLLDDGGGDERGDDERGDDEGDAADDAGGG